MNTTQQSSSKKTFIIIIVIIAVAALIYFYNLGNSSADSASSLQESGASAETQAVGSRVLSLLNQISSLKIDSSIFTSASYKSLVDYTIAIPEQNIGRPNPFAPIPGSVPAKTH